jgi:phosphatidylserine decarboxylase
MKIHKEGYKNITIAAILFIVINLISFNFFSFAHPFLATIIFLVTLVVFLFIVSFFRVPFRASMIDQSIIYCPADGKIVAIEETMENEYFNNTRLQISIFMSPADVHVNLVPVSGIVMYSKHHAGKFLPAWNPKSSLNNERHTIVIQSTKGDILIRQIAGALAKRIVNYLHVNQQVRQGMEMGFIKFGSRVDVLLPLNAQVKINLNDKVKAGVTILAKW